MTIADTLRKITATLSRTTKSLVDELADMRARIVKLREQVQYNERSPIPVAEVVANVVPTVIADAALLWRRDYGDSLWSGLQSLASPSAIGSRTLPWNLDSALPWGAVCVSDPAGAARILEGLVKNIRYEAGPPSSERPAILDRLMRELAELETGEERFVDEAAAAGVQIRHRPEVEAARQQEARRVELQAAAQAERARQEAEIDRRQRLPRGEASAYLTTGKLS